MPTMDEIFTKSVTEGDLAKVRDGSVLQVIVPFYQGYDRIPMPPQLPPFWNFQRDLLLRATVHHEAMWAAAISIAITKGASLGWEIKGNVSRSMLKETQELILQADSRRVGWVGFLSKHLRDFLCTDNGAFVEIVRATRAPGSRIIGLRHLDSVRCTRTGDPLVPVIYRDRRGILHELKDHQVMTFSDMPDPSDTYYGVGLCAASRAYPSIYKLAAIEKYLQEKVAGLRPLAIYIVNGVLDKQLKDSVTAAKSEEVSRGLVSYMGAVIIGIPEGQTPGLVTIPLAELPDRFQRREEFDISLLSYSDNLGLDPQELQPLSGQAIGTGAQSQVLHEKARGKGLIAWKQDFAHALNEFVMPRKLAFSWHEKDYGDLTQQAGISKTYVDIAVARIGAQITTSLEERQLLVDKGELPKEFLEVDPTTTLLLEDTNPANAAIADMAPAPPPQVWGTPQLPGQIGEVSQTIPEAAQPIVEANQVPRVWGLSDAEQPNGAVAATPANEKKPEKKVWGQKSFGDSDPSLTAEAQARAVLSRAVLDKAAELFEKAVRDA